MKAFCLTLILLSLAVLGAHFLRYDNVAGVAVSLALIGLLYVRRPWVARLVQIALLLGAIEWAHTLYELVQVRMAHGAPVARMALIIGAVTVITLVSALLFQTQTMKRVYRLREAR